MQNKLLKKVLEYIVTFFFIITLNFFIPRLMPGDPFTFLSSDENNITVTFTDEQIEKYESYYGLDKPIFIQYLSYLKNTFTGYLGYSIIMNDDVLNIVLKRASWTISLIIASTFISAIFGTILGCISAYNRKNHIDKILYFIFILISQIPSFLLGLIFLFYFSAHLGIFPLSGGAPPFAENNLSVRYLFDLIHYAVLPVITLSFASIGGFYFISRNSMISVLSKDYIVTAKAKGLKKTRIIFDHALRNAILPVITKIFLSFGYVVGGAVLVENVFKYPGLGTLMRNAVFYRDYPLIQGIFIFMALMVLTMNLVSDLICRKLDPRLR